MSKTLKDLNWSLFIVNVILALITAVSISIGGDFTWKGFACTIAGVLAKDLFSFFSDAKKQLSE